MFSVEISNAAGSRFANPTCTFMQLLKLFPFMYKLMQISLILLMHWMCTALYYQSSTSLKVFSLSLSCTLLETGFVIMAVVSK